MEQDKDTRVRRKRRRRKKKSTGRKFLTGCLVFLLLLIAAAGIVAFMVYRDVRNTTDDMYEEIEQETHGSRERPIVVDDGEDPFSVLLLGIDTGDFDREYVGRSDTMMIMTINPNTEKTSIVSIPRDTYTEIVGRGTMDKINHAYAFGGASMSINSVQNLFDVPIDYYVSVNMEGMQQIVDAVGGVNVVPPITFSHSGYTFYEGEQTHLDGARALAYSRMRYDDPDGDYGRQGRQRQLIEATLQKVASVDSIMNYRSVLAAMGGNMQTNMSFDDMVDMFANYRGAAGDVEEVQLSGSGQMINGVYYEMIPDEEVARVSNHLQTELELN